MEAELKYRIMFSGFYHTVSQGSGKNGGAYYNLKII
jgi:hypothetical protein